MNARQPGTYAVLFRTSYQSDLIRWVASGADDKWDSYRIIATGTDSDMHDLVRALMKAAAHE